MRSIQQDTVATPIQAEKRRQAAPKRHVCRWCDVIGGRGLETYLLWRDWPLVSLPELLNNSLVATEILLAANEDDGETGAEVHDFGNPLEIGKEEARRRALVLVFTDLEEERGGIG